MATVPASTRSTAFTVAVTSAGPFNIGFRLFDLDSLDVYVDGTKTTAFSIQATFDDGYTDTGTITFTSPVDAGKQVIIDGALTPRREQDYINSNGLTDKLNIELARIWSAVSEVKRDSERSLRSMVASDPFSPGTDKLLTWDGSKFVSTLTIDEVVAAANGAAVTLQLTTPFTYGAVGNGVADDRAAFVAMNAAGGHVYIVKPPVSYNLSSGFTLTNVAPLVDPTQTWAELTDGNLLDWSFGMFRDEGFLPIHRLAGRTLMGEASRHSGNRLGVNGYGDDALSQNVASWVVKNSQVAAMSSDAAGRIGFTGAVWVQPGTAALSAAGVVGIARNDGISGTGRGGYFEAISVKTAGFAAADLGAEVQVGNRTGQVPVVSAYAMGGSVVNGMQIAVESQTGYTLGNSDTAYAAATQPAGAAIDVTGGSLNASYQKWTAGFVFRDGALVRDGGGFANALIMAQKHRLEWEVSAGAEGAALWSEVTSAGSRMALAFVNQNVELYGPAGQKVAGFRFDTTGAGTVNNHLFRSARTGIAPAILAEGSDTNVGLEFTAKGTGAIRLTSHGGAGENLRINPPATAPVDYLTIAGSATGGTATIGAAGTSTDIDVVLTPKGAGNVRFGTRTASSDVPVTGYIEIKDAGGTVRRLAVVG